MTIGIIGAGAIGQSVAKHLAAAGIKTLISNDKDPQSLAAIALALGPTVIPATRQDAAAASIVIVAVRWEHRLAALAKLPPWQGRIVIDAMNPIIPPGFTVAPLGDRTSSELIADLVPGARLVKAFNTLPPNVLASGPSHADGRRVIVMSGDDPKAKQDVGQLIERIGFSSVDLGELATGGRLQQFPGGVFAALNLIRLT